MFVCSLFPMTDLRPSIPKNAPYARFVGSASGISGLTSDVVTFIVSRICY